ncbi:hypothetical protein M9H77_25401 [Catharanthus roseus]|uniref:Uncharacterized protein n=1 Tax=Catharanthus roseus TaxID=4058 RepID=A0ACC0A6T1_CATRO|nr:hypothetical protein M9H77_25401 [Catharanthus roseus]
MDSNLWSVRMTMGVPSFYEEPSYFYFTLYNINNDNEMCYFWTIAPNFAKEGIQVLIEFIPIQRQTVSITHDTNTINMTKHVTTITQIISDEPSMLYLTVDDDDDENDHSNEDNVVSSEFESENINDAEEEELQTPRYLSQTSTKKCKYYFKRFVCTRGHAAVNGKHIHCLVLMLLQFVDKMETGHKILGRNGLSKSGFSLQDVADVACRDIIEKFVITPVQAR